MDVDSLSDEIVDLKAQIEDLESRLRDAQDLVEDAYREGFNDARPAETEENSWMRSLSRQNLR